MTNKMRLDIAYAIVGVVLVQYVCVSANKIAAAPWSTFLRDLLSGIIQVA